MNEARRRDAASYQLQAEDYERRWRSYLRHTHQMAGQDLGNAEGQCIVDVACGTGHLFEGLKARPGAASATRWVGIDRTQEMLQQARQKSLSQVNWIQGRMESLPLIDASVDHLFCLSALQFSTDPAATLAEFARVLVKGGQLSLIIWRPEDPIMTLFAHLARLRRFALAPAPTQSQVHQYLQQAGFANITGTRFRHGPRWALAHLQAHVA